MKVADLQQHIADLARLLESAGVKGEPIKDLNAIRDGLVPFRDAPLKVFADFLIRAEAYRSGGEVPLTPPKGGKKAAAKTTAKTTTKPTPPNVPALAAEVKRVYDHAADPATTETVIDAILARLEPVDKKGLVIIAEAIELKGVGSKAKAAIITAIRQRITARKGSSQRVGILDRPTPSSASVPGPVSDNLHTTAPQPM